MKIKFSSRVLHHLTKLPLKVRSSNFSLNFSNETEIETGGGGEKGIPKVEGRASKVVAQRESICSAVSLCFWRRKKTGGGSLVKHRSTLRSTVHVTVQKKDLTHKIFSDFTLYGSSWKLLTRSKMSVAWKRAGPIWIWKINSCKLWCSVKVDIKLRRKDYVKRA